MPATPIAGAPTCLAFLRRHTSRIVALHFRDYRDGQQVPLGQGTFPLAEVAATFKQLNWQGWAINEEEREDSSKRRPRL